MQDKYTQTQGQRDEAQDQAPSLGPQVSLNYAVEHEDGSWIRRVNSIAVHQPADQMTLRKLTNLDAEIRAEIAAMREEPIGALTALSLICGYKIQILSLRQRTIHPQVIQW